MQVTFFFIWRKDCNTNEGYKTMMNSETAEEDVNEIMKAIDYNNSGAIDYTGSGLNLYEVS